MIKPENPVMQDLTRHTRGARRRQYVFHLYYFLSYVGIASLYPYLSIFFQEHGRSDTQIGLIFAVGSIGGVVAQPVLGLLADRASDYRRILALSVGLSPLIALGYFFSPTYWLVLVTAFVLSVVQSIATPLSDAITAEMGETHSFTFGQVRLWGSLGFAVTTALGGYLYSRVGYGAGFLAFPAVSALVMTCLPFLPKKQAIIARRESIRQNVRALRSNRALITFIVLAFFVAVASAVNGQLFPLYYAAMRYDLQYLGLVFMIAALIEIPLFRLSGSLLRKVGPGTLIVISAFTYTAKWFILALGPPLWVVFAVQLLDGIAYTFMTVGAVELIQVIGTPGLKSTGQSLYSAVNWSLSGIVGSLGGGYLFDHIGPAHTYLILSLLTGGAGMGFVVYQFRMGARLGRSVTKSPD